MSHKTLSALIATLASACSPAINGAITHDEDREFSHPGPFEFTPESHAVVELRQTDLGVVDRVDIDGIDRFPIRFKFEPIGLEDGVEYSIQAVVYQGAGDEEQVGDLINETRTAVASSFGSVRVVVSGLEDCSLDEAGGFCLGAD